LVVQASGVRREGAWARDREAVARVESGGRETLEELREVLGSMDGPIERTAEPARTPAAPEPGLGWVDVLVGCSGIPVAVECVTTATSRGPVIANVVAGVALGLPLVWRRTHPLISCGAFLVVAVLMTSLLTPLAGTVTILLPVSFLAYALGAHTRGPRRAASLVLLLGGGLLVSLANSTSDPSDGLLPSLVWLGLAFGAGVLAAQHADRALRLADLLERVEAGREDDVRLAVAEQRQAIARDLHDTVAHAMTVVCLHAEAAQQQWSDDHAVEQSLTIIESAAREAMGHLRTGLGALEAQVDPAEGTADEVRAFAASLGVPATVSVDVEMSSAERSLARRVVREGLVNVARHATGTTARVRITREGEGLVVAVSNAASHGPVFTDGSQRGLAGLSELFAMRGGSVEHGSTPEGGYAVTAYLPAERSSVPV
jgi:signal transduction histidine kinase